MRRTPAGSPAHTGTMTQATAATPVASPAALAGLKVIELGQLLTATRSASWGDFFGNAAGACLGTVTGWLIGLMVRRARRTGTAL